MNNTNNNYKKIWNQDLVKLLIAQYEQHENLYNTKHPMYEDRNKRLNSLSEICKSLQEVNNDISVEDIKKKIHTIRTQYIKETRDIEKFDRSEPKLWCYNRLEFLKVHCNTRRYTVNISNIDDNNMESEFYTESNYNSNSNTETIITTDNNIAHPAYYQSNIEEVPTVIKCEPPDCSQNVLEHNFSIEIKSEPPVFNDIDMESPSFSKSNIEIKNRNGANSEANVSSQTNTEGDIYNHANSNTSNCNKRKKPLKLEDRINHLKNLLIQRYEDKSQYDWLGKQVVYEIELIKNAKIKQDTAWNIQKILREASLQDKALRKRQSEQISSEIRLESQSSFADCSSKEQPTCSSYSSPSFLSPQQPSDLLDKNVSDYRTPEPLVTPLQIIAVNSYSNTSQDNLQHSLDNIKVEEDYVCL